MKKVLIITYYWPPAGGSGVQRWLKFVKYLPDFSWQPIVYTPENPEMPVQDDSLLKDIPKEAIIVKQPIWEPYQLYKKFTGKNKDEKLSTGFPTATKKSSITHKIAVWLRGNLFIPDARKYWIKPSVKYLNDYLIKNKVDAIISTGPPHSMHLIALALHKKTNIPWIADFRDPWTNIDFYKELKLTARSDKKHRLLEQQVVKNASRVLVIGKTMKDEFESLSGRSVDYIPNGFDETDVYSGKIELDKKFSITHIGTLSKSRNPKQLWKCLHQLTLENAEFEKHLEIKFVGKTDADVLLSIKEAKLEKYLTRVDYLPHAAITKVQQQAQVLLLLLNDTPNAKGILTGKFFEYMSAKRPILCVGPSDGDVAEILKETTAGNIFDYNDKEGLKKYCLQLFEKYKAGTLQVDSKNIDKYSRKQLTADLSKILNKIT